MITEYGRPINKFEVRISTDVLSRRLIIKKGGSLEPLLINVVIKERRFSSNYSKIKLGKATFPHPRAPHLTRGLDRSYQMKKLAHMSQCNIIGHDYCV